LINREGTPPSFSGSSTTFGYSSAGLSRREIGAQLYISLNTVKTHIRELNRKLGASSRADAVARAEALALLDRTESPG
jgi:ATP/maltotriose-dependent transcriptional regulator MalT